MKTFLVVLLSFSLLYCGKKESRKQVKNTYILKAWGHGHRLRETPGFNGKKSETLIPDGATVSFLEKGNLTEKDVKGKEGTWWKIRYKDTTGWAFSAYLKPQPTPIKENSQPQKEEKPNSVEEKEANSRFYIAAKGGLKLREKPNLSVKKLRVNPNGSYNVEREIVSGDKDKFLHDDYFTTLDCIRPYYQ